jgi:hypothetical protein
MDFFIITFNETIRIDVEILIIILSFLYTFSNSFKGVLGVVRKFRGFLYFCLKLNLFDPILKVLSGAKQV